MSDDLRLPDQEIEEVVRRFATRTLSVNDPAWPALRDASISKRRMGRRQWLSRLFGGRGPARSSQAVGTMYEPHWAGMEDVHVYVGGLNDRVLTVQWRDNGYELKPQGIRHLHLKQIARTIRSTDAKSVLEVGSGNGNLVLTLAGMLPDVAFSAVELTESGIKAANALMAFDQMPDEFVAAAPEPIVDRKAHHRVAIIQGSAAKLPFANAAFDLVYTRLALEQMESIREPAMREIARVAGKTLILIEPWRDFNERGPGRDYIQRQGYFAAHARDLKRYGFDLVLVSDDIPQKVQFSAGPVIATRRA